MAGGDACGPRRARTLVQLVLLKGSAEELYTLKPKPS